MTTEQDNFQKWFVSPLRTLNKEADAAFTVLMVAIPLLERYLREKSGVDEGDLNDAFYDEFHTIFGAPARDLVPKLWRCYRHGLLHQATFSKRNRRGRVMPASFITSQVALIEYDSQEDAFYVNPETFSEKVIVEIQHNFGVFEARSSVNHPLPQVRSTSGATDPGDVPPPTGVL